MSRKKERISIQNPFLSHVRKQSGDRVHIPFHADSIGTIQLVIALTARIIPGLHVLCGARTPEQVLDNAKALTLQLDGADAVRMKWDVDAIS